MANNLKKKKNSGMAIMIFLGLLIFLLGGLALLITYNPGDINNTVFKNIPILSNFVPQEKEQIEVSLEEKYYDYSKPRLKEAVFDLEKEKITLNDQIKSLTDQLADKDKEINTLKEFEDKYTALKQEKDDSANVIANLDKKAYANYYDKVNPELAKQIYTEITKDMVADDTAKKYIAKLDAMDVTAVAKMLDDMMKTDFDLVIKILQNMDEDRSAQVIQSMDPKNMTKITKKLTGGME